MPAVLEALHQAADRHDLSESQAHAAMIDILNGNSTPALVAALLTALRMKGEVAAEVSGFARAMRDSAMRVTPQGTAAERLVDTCGTGGDGGTTFNVSTAAALVVAGSGLAVAKHGNRSISSQCGSADVLEALGVRIGLDSGLVARSIDEIGIGFLFAPTMHPAMRHAGPVRQELGMRTVFNMLGPLTNPAGAGVQVMGVYEERIVGLAAEALARLGTRRALIVHGSDGMDEITLSGPTSYAEVRDGSIITGSVTPADFGFRRSAASLIAGGDARANAATILDVLRGNGGPARDIVVMNAGAALRVAGLARTWREGAAMAAESIDSGAARAKLDALVAFSSSDAPGA